MHRLGLKLYSINASYMKEAADLHGRGLYDYIELLPVPGSRSAAAGWKALGVPFVIHAPHFSFGVNFSVAALREENLAAAREALAWADALEVPFVIFHPGTGGDMGEAARQLKAIGDRRTLVENKPYRTVDGLHRCVGCSHEEIRLAMSESGAGFCLDIGHAVSYARNAGADWLEYLKGFRALGPAMYHVSDGVTASGLDTHDHIGAGDYDWRSILPLIPDGAMITLETRKDSPESLEDFRRDAEAYRRLEAVCARKLSLRRMSAADKQDVFELSNDPFVRRFSVGRAPISWESHEAWFVSAVSDPGKDFFVAEMGGSFAGQVRYSPENAGDMSVSLSLAPPFRGLGLAPAVLRESAALVFSGRPDVKGIAAYIDPANESSVRSFSRAGYVRRGEAKMSGRTFSRYYLERGGL